jgi:hypothetical protein
MIVRQSRMPVTRWASASHHPARTNQRMLAMTLSPLSRAWLGTSTLPKGTGARSRRA